MRKCIAICLDKGTACKLAESIRDRFDLAAHAVGTEAGSSPNDDWRVQVDCFSDNDFNMYVLCANFFLRGQIFGTLQSAKAIQETQYVSTMP